MAAPVIEKVDFIGFSVLGPAMKSCQAYRTKGADAWPRSWTATLEGPHLVLEDGKRRIEVPRARCVVYSDMTLAKGEPEDSAGFVSKGKK